jgi:hypothetical protein
MKQFSLKKSLKSSLKTSILILKLIIPIYILADILYYYNIFSYISFLIEPVTEAIGLPAQTSLSILSGMFLSEYAAVAFAAPLELTAQQWTTLAVFVGVCHALVIESLIIKKIGISNIYSYTLRLVCAFLLAYITSILPSSWFAQAIVENSNHNMQTKKFESLYAVIENSVSNALILTFEIIILVTILILIMDLIKSKIKTSNNGKFSSRFSLFVGILLGITYGAGVLIQEAKTGNMTKPDILYTSTFLLICHAIIEDTLLFVILGANFTIVVLVRLIGAIIISFIILKLYNKSSKLQKPTFN